MVNIERFHIDFSWAFELNPWFSITSMFKHVWQYVCSGMIYTKASAGAVLAPTGRADDSAPHWRNIEQSQSNN